MGGGVTLYSALNLQYVLNTRRIEFLMIAYGRNKTTWSFKQYIVKLTVYILYIQCTVSSENGNV